jgi:transcriptional pleiotropic regulator of transition state genes
MSETGIVRRVDDLGRIVIPMELRRTLGINVKAKHHDSCVMCGSTEDIVRIKGRAVCRTCVVAVKNAV